MSDAPEPSPVTGEAAPASVKTLFLEVCDLPDAAAVHAHLAKRGAAADVAADVIALVEADAATRVRFTRPVAGMARAAMGPELAVGAQLGPWRLVEVLGEGGMGQVFLAERTDGLYEQRAAVKLLRGFSGPGATEQLARERQILAGLNHPHIARLLDGGTTPGGRPYLVMDFVAGRRLDEHVQDHAQTLETRLALFDMVCDAVAYAHRQLVVHCDIKPGNVLVDETGQAKLLDFGIAQLQSRGDDGAQPGARNTYGLTPRYASPEQRAGEPGRPATDIYSLGRLLDELLQALPAATPRRREWQAIVNRATAEDAADRYPTVEALQADLQRLLKHRPVQALGAGPGYRIAKLLRREWPWALVATGAVLLSVAFTLRVLHERDRALQAEAQAAREAAALKQVSGFMVDLFQGADPSRGGRPDITAAALVDRGRERVDDALRSQPELHGRMLGVLGDVYGSMGQPQRAIALHERTAAMAAQRGDAQAEATALRALASALSEAGQPGKALVPARRALQLRREGGATPELQAQAMVTLGYALTGTGGFDEAQALLDEALALRRGWYGQRHIEVAAVLHLQGLLERRRVRPTQALPLFEEALSQRRELRGPAHPDTLTSQQQTAATLSELGRTDEALPLLRDLVAQRRALYGDRSSSTATALNELAGTLQDAGRAAEAVPVYREAALVEEQVAGRPSSRLAVATNNLANALEDLADPEAGVLYRDALAQRQAVLPPGDLGIARGQHNLARWLMRNGRLADAQPLAEAALAGRSAKLPPAHDERLASMLLLGELAVLQGRRPAAQAALDGVSAVVGADEATMRPGRRAGLLRLRALLQEDAGDAAAGLALRRQVVAVLTPAVHPQHPVLAQARRELAAAEARTPPKRGGG